MDNWSANQCQSGRWSPHPRHEIKVDMNRLTTELAIDCEMVEARANRRRFSVLARVSIVNSYCEPILDTYVDPEYPVSDYRTQYSGIRPRDLDNAPSYQDVSNCIYNLLEDDRIIVGHDLKQDLAVLGLKSYPLYLQRDTSACYMSYFGEEQKPSLKRLAQAVLGQTIQVGAHNSMEDASTAMQLYNEWKRLDRNECEAIPSSPTQSRNKSNKRRNRRRRNGNTSYNNNDNDNNNHHHNDDNNNNNNNYHHHHHHHQQQQNHDSSNNSNHNYNY